MAVAVLWVTKKKTITSSKRLRRPGHCFLLARHCHLLQNTKKPKLLRHLRHANPYARLSIYRFTRQTLPLLRRLRQHRLLRAHLGRPRRPKRRLELRASSRLPCPERALLRLHVRHYQERPLGRLLERLRFLLAHLRLSRQYQFQRLLRRLQPRRHHLRRHLSSRLLRT